MTTPLVGGADLNGTAFGDPTNLRFDRLYRASPIGQSMLGNTIGTSSTCLENNSYLSAMIAGRAISCVSL
eukprot:2178006-Pleurochrysis_carterae.AAC.1